MALQWPSWRRRPTTRPRTDRGAAHTIQQLRLECLEDRAVPSTFTVNTTLDDVTPANGKFSLREAITRADFNPGADVIVVPAGVFKFTPGGSGENGNVSGDLDIHDDVTIQGAGAGISIIHGQLFDRVLDIYGSAPSSIKVVLQGLTIRNGHATGAGGAILLGNADLVVRDCVISGNRASLSGGGISNGNGPGTGSVTLVRTIVGRNVAGAHGGGLAVIDSPITVKDSSIRRNVAGGLGGGIRAGTATLTNSRVNGNTAGNEGGGIFAATATLTNSRVSGNSASGSGGGISAATANLTNCTVIGNHSLASGGGISASVPNVTNSTVSNNTAMTDGGGIAAVTANLTNSAVSGNTAGGTGGGLAANVANLTNSTISGNSTAGNGGGLTTNVANLTNRTISGNNAGTDGGGVWAISASLLNCTVVENLAHEGGGLFHNPGGTFNVKNTIVALNLVDFLGAGLDVSGTFTSQGHNLIGIGGVGFVNGANGDIVGSLVNPIDPKLGPLANNGGPTKTRALLAGSPAIDHGDNNGAPATDQRGAGFARVKDGNFDGVAIVDIGAFEK
jgi:CSLREA domain-containing protein